MRISVAGGDPKRHGATAAADDPAIVDVLDRARAIIGSRNRQEPP